MLGNWSLNIPFVSTRITTPLDPQVIEAVTSAMINNWSNPSSQYAKSEQTKALINESRQSIADTINTTSSSDIIQRTKKAK